MDTITNAQGNIPEIKDKMIAEIKDKMIEVAKKKETITYSDLFEPYGLKMKNRDHRNAVYGILDDISKKEYQAKRYLLSSVVVRADTKRPGEGFYQLGEDLGMDISKNDSPEEYKKKFWEDRLKETYDEWRPK